MGIEAVVTGLFGLASAATSAISAHHTQAANAAAQSALNKETMEFNQKEAKKARDWQSAQAVIDRQFNSAEAVKQRSFSAKQAEIARNYDAQQALLSRQFEERLSSTAHQREVSDLKAAGLNPVLSATGGSGASTPVAPVIGAPMPSGSTASHSSSGGAAASIGALNAYMKKDVVSQFVNTALDTMRLNNDIKRAQAEDKQADAAWKNSQTNAKRQVQDQLESVARITKIESETDLNKWKSLSEKEQVNLWKEKITSEIRERTDKHNLSEAQQKAVMITAHAAATSASAQAHLADIQDRIQTAESPERINKLQKEANYWQSEFDKNKWIMDDPEKILKREWWKNNEGAVGVKEAANIIGEVFHSGMFLPIK